MSQFVQERPAPTVETLATVLINSLSRQEDSLVLVLDDLHPVNDSAIFAFLARFIELSMIRFSSPALFVQRVRERFP